MGYSTVVKLVASVVIAGAGFVGGMKAAPVFGIGSGDQGAEPVVTVDTTLVKNSFADIGELATESYNFTQVGNALRREPRCSAWKCRARVLITSLPIRVR